MKKLLSVILILCLVFASAVPVFAADTSGASLELVKYKGKVTVTTSAGKNVELKSDKGTKLVSGYTVKTGAASYAYISLDQTQAVKMDASTTVTIDQNGKKLDINLVSGSLSYDVKAPLKKDQSTTVSTSNSITGIRGTFGLVRTFFDITLGRQISTTILFEGHSKVSTLGNNGSVVSTKDVFASNLLESIENVAKLSQMTKEDFAGFVAMELAEDPALLSRVEKALASSDNPEAAAIDVREIAANAEEILAAEEKQAEEDAKTLEAELAAQKAEQDRLEAAAKTDKLDGQDDAVQLFDGETATDPAADAVSAEEAENASGDSGSGSGGNTGTTEYNPADENDFRTALSDAAASGKNSVINAPAIAYSDPIAVGQGVTINAQSGFQPSTLNLNGGKLTGTLDNGGAGGTVINVTGTGSEISGTVTANTLNVGNGGGLNIASGSTVNTSSVSVSGGNVTNNGSVTTNGLGVSSGTMTNRGTMTTDSANISGTGTYDTTAGTSTYNESVTVTDTGKLKGNTTINGGQNAQSPHFMSIGSSANGDSPEVTGNVTLENNAELHMNNGTLNGNVNVNGCTVYADNGTITGKINGNSYEARVIVDGATISGGITGSFASDYQNPGVKINSGSVSGGINLTEGNVTVAGGTVSGTDCGIRSLDSIKVTGGTVSGTNYGIYFNVSGKSVEISGGNITGKTGFYIKSEGAGASSAYVDGGTITGTNGDGIRVDGTASLKIGDDPAGNGHDSGYGYNISGTAVISSTGGNNTGGINSENAGTTVSLISGTIKNTATSGYALKGDKFYIGTGMNDTEIVAAKSVKLYAPTKARVADNSNFTSQALSGQANTYALTSLDGTGANTSLNAVTVTTAQQLESELATADAATDVLTTITIGGTNEISGGTYTLSDKVTLVSANNFKPTKVTLTGGTLKGTINDSGTTIETSHVSGNGNNTTCILDGTFNVGKISVGRSTTLVIPTTTSSISANIDVIYGVINNYSPMALEDKEVLLNNGSIYNLGTHGYLTIRDQSNGASDDLTMTDGSYIGGGVALTGYAKGDIAGGTITSTNTATLIVYDNASVDIGSATITNTDSGNAIAMADHVTVAIAAGANITSTGGNAISFGGDKLTVSGGTITGTTGIDAYKNSGSGTIQLNGGTITGTVDNGINVSKGITAKLGSDEDTSGAGQSGQGFQLGGNAKIVGSANGILTSDNGTCHLLQGTVETSSTDTSYYTLNGTGFVLGDSNNDQQKAAIRDGKTVKLKFGSSGTANLTSANITDIDAGSTITQVQGTDYYAITNV